MERLVICINNKNTPYHYWRKTKTLIVGQWYFIDYKIYECFENDLVRKDYVELMTHIFNQYIVRDRDKKIEQILCK